MLTRVLAAACPLCAVYFSEESMQARFYSDERGERQLAEIRERLSRERNNRAPGYKSASPPISQASSPDITAPAPAPAVVQTAAAASVIRSPESEGVKPLFAPLVTLHTFDAAASDAPCI